MAQWIRIYNDDYLKNTDGSYTVTWEKSLEEFKTNLHKYESFIADTAELSTGRSYSSWDYTTAVWGDGYSNGSLVATWTNEGNSFGLGGEIGGYTMCIHKSWLNMTNIINSTRPKIVVKKLGGYSVKETPASFINVKVTYKEPVVTGITLVRDSANKQYNCVIKSNLFDKADIEVIHANYDGNGSEKVSYTLESNLTTFAVKESYLQQGENKISAKVWNGDAYVLYSISFMHYTPTISKLAVTNDGNLIDNTTALTWESTNQAKAEIIANGSIIGTTTTAKTYIIPKGKLKTGSNTIQVMVYNTADANVVNSQVSASISQTITLSRIMPTVSSIVLNGSNTDNELTLRWNSTNQSSYSVIANSTSIATGTTEKSVMFPSGTLKPSYKSLKVIVYYNSGFDTVEASSEIDVSLTQNTPIIYNLEPSNLNKNVDESLVATFETNEFCDRWELKANNTYISTGTAERKVVYGGNSFKKGNNTLTLTTFYSPTWSNGKVIRTATKTVSFNGYGAPNAPVLNVNEVYNTANPLISWNADEEQVAFEYILLKEEEIIASETISSENNSITLNGLEDKTQYTIKVRLKNKYELYSDYSIETFSTLFNDILLPDFYLIEGNNSVQITINGHQESTFKSISVYRKDGFNNWLEIADNCNVEDSLTDSTLPCNTDIKYKLRVFNTDGAYKDTEEKTIRISIVNYWLTNMEDFKQSFRMDFVESSYGFNRNVVYKQYTNQIAPRVFKGKTLYNTVKLVVTMPNDEAFKFINFIETANDYNAFCYRSWKGEKLFVSVVLNEMTPVEAQLMQITLTLTEINFKESKIYSGGGYRKIVYLNGEYSLDGSIDLSGYDDSVIKVVG